MYMNTVLSDDEIMHLVQKGETSHYAHIIDRYSKPVFTRVFYVVRDRDEAEDAVQEVFVRAWQKAHRYTPGLPGGLKAWLLAIARNVALDSARRKKDTAMSSFENEEGINILFETVDDGSLSRFEELIAAEDEKAAWESLRLLSDNEQQAIRLYYKEQMTFAEIGRMLNKPLHTIKSHHRRGLEKLRRIFKKKESPA